MWVVCEDGGQRECGQAARSIRTKSGFESSARRCPRHQLSEPMEISERRLELESREIDIDEKSN
jgi:hypothetical protein